MIEIELGKIHTDGQGICFIELDSSKNTVMDENGALEMTDLYLKLQQPQNPTKIFVDFNLALAWLKSIELTRQKEFVH